MLSNAITALFKPQSDLLSNEEAAAYIGVTPRTLEVWRCKKRHRIPYIKVGRLVKYRRHALDAFLENATVGGDLEGSEQC
jgi:excisionase family DNA binding protein